MNLFKVVHDGPSRPMIETPHGRLLSLSQFENGRWNSYTKEESDCAAIVSALNQFLVTHVRDEILQPQQSSL